MDANELAGAHQASNPFAATAPARGLEVRVHPWGAIHPRLRRWIAVMVSWRWASWRDRAEGSRFRQAYYPL